MSTRTRRSLLVLALLSLVASVTPAHAGMVLDLVNRTVFDVQVRVMNLTGITSIPGFETLAGWGTINRTFPSSASVQVTVRQGDETVCNGIVDAAPATEGTQCVATIIGKMGRTGLAAAFDCPVTITRSGADCKVQVDVATGQ